MNYTDLYEALNHVDHSRQKRKEMANVLLQNPKLLAPLLQIVEKVDDPLSCKACWILEFVAKTKLELLYPFIDQITACLSLQKEDSSIRPLSNICEIMVLKMDKNNDFNNPIFLNDSQVNLMVTSAFDWLIGDFKVAAKAHSMTILMVLGKKIPWIHKELILLLKKEYHEGSAAYKARARMILSVLQKSGIDH